MNNMNDVPAFQVGDTAMMEDVKPVIKTEQTSIPETIVLPTPSTVEPVVAPAPTTSTSSSSAHLTTVTNSSSTTSTSTASFNQGHTAQASSSHTPKSTQATPSNLSANANHEQILTKTRLQDLVKEIDPCEQLDEEVEELLLELVDDFVTSSVNSACVFAKHRNANTVEVKDVQLYLEKMYNMWIPGFGTEEVKPFKKLPITEAHKQRVSLIRKSTRKY